MDVTPLIKSGTQVVQSYAGGRFKVSGQVYDGGVIVTPVGTREWDAPESVAGLTLDHFQSLIDESRDIDVVLLGCGARPAFLPLKVKTALKDKGLSVDVMDTGAACRTYNVLVAEGRRVAAVLFPV